MKKIEKLKCIEEALSKLKEVFNDSSERCFISLFAGDNLCAFDKIEINKDWTPKDIYNWARGRGGRYSLCIRGDYVCSFK